MTLKGSLFIIWGPFSPFTTNRVSAKFLTRNSLTFPWLFPDFFLIFPDSRSTFYKKSIKISITFKNLWFWEEKFHSKRKKMLTESQGKLEKSQGKVKEKYGNLGSKSRQTPCSPTMQSRVDCLMCHLVMLTIKANKS